jgi:hypothetical protein
MRTLHSRSAALAAAVLTMAGQVVAQGRPPAPLNALDVRQLVARAEPADNIRLNAHFTALAERYAAEARKHTAMSGSFTANPSRNIGAGMGAHCKRLADLNTQSAAAVRDLAAYYEKLAGGAPAAPPQGGTPFQAGAGAPEPTEQELNALAAKASTPADHRALEEYFLTLAKRYSGEAAEHIALAQASRGSRSTQAAQHHDRLASLSRDAATEATAAAEMHRGFAAVAR